MVVVVVVDSSWALEYHVLILFSEKGTIIMK